MLLGQNDNWVSGYKGYQQFDLKGRVGVTGVKKVNHVKKIWKQLIYKNLLCHLVDNSQTFKKVNDDLVIRPHSKGSKVKMAYIFKIFKMLLLLQIK